MIREVVALGTLALALTSPIGACGSDDDRETRATRTTASRPAPPPLPAGAVAVVGDTPIARAELERRVRGLRAIGQGPSARRLRNRVLAALVLRATLEHEILRRGSAISAAMMRDAWRERRSRLRARGRLARYMKERTRDSIQLDTQLMLLRDTIHEIVSAEDRKHPEAAIARFEREFPKRWHHFTVCAGGVTVAACAR